MTDITATSSIAPAVLNLTAANAISGVGINIVASKLSTNPVTRTQIWASQTNDRSTATLEAEIFGSVFFFQGTVSTTYYFWARNVNINGVANGAWYPSSSTAGVSATVVEITALPSNNTASTYVGDGNFQQHGSITVKNDTIRNSAINILFNAQQEYITDVPVQFKCEVRNNLTASQTLFRTYPVMTTRNYTPTFLIHRYTLPAGADRTFKFYSQATGVIPGNVTLSFPQYGAFWDFNNPTVGE